MLLKLLKNNNVIDLLIDGYIIEASNATEIDICPYNANVPFTYKWDDNNKLTELFINLTLVTPDFYEDLKQVLLKHWYKDTDML